MCAMRVTDRLIAPSRGDIASVTRWCTGKGRSVDPFLADYLIEAFRLAPLVGLDASIVVAQSCHECFNPQSGLPWDSHWWRTRGNPAGLGITGDPADNAASGTWENGTFAARAQIVHIYVYAVGHVPSNHPLEPYIHLDPRYLFVPNPGSARTLNDLTGRWAVDPKYAEKIAAKGNAIFPGLPDQGQEPPVALTIRQGITPAANDNRPGITVNDDGTTSPGKLLRAPFKINWHETANTNPGADAEMHRKFVWNGGGTQGVSFHFCVDDKEAVQLLPLDEQGIHIGTTEGNATCIGIETCVNKTGAGWVKAKEHLVALTVAILKGDAQINYGRRKASDFSADRITIHGDWGTGTSCPARIRQEGSRNALVQAVRNGLGGTPPPPPPPTVDYPDHLDAGLMARMFGEVVGEDSVHYAYDEDGPVSTIWREQYGPHGWPALKAVWSYEDGARRIFVWNGGPPLFIGADGVPVIVE